MVPSLRFSVVNGFLSAKYANKAREGDLSGLLCALRDLYGGLVFLVLSIRKVNLGVL